MSSIPGATGPFTFTPSSSGTQTSEFIAPLDLKEFGQLHEVPQSDFSVKGEANSRTDVLFHIFDKDSKELGFVKIKLSPNWLEDEEFRKADDIHKNLFKTNFLSDGTYIRLQRISISGKDERGLKKVAKTLLQTLMEFAKKMNAENKIFGDLPFCATKRLHELGMRYYSDEQYPTVEERAEVGQVRKHERVTIYLPDECAKKFNQRIKRTPIFPNAATVS